MYTQMYPNREYKSHIFSMVFSQKKELLELYNAMNETDFKEGILGGFLSKNRAKAKKVSIYEYDEEKHMRQEREQHFTEGKIAGKIEAILELLEDLGVVPEEFRNKANL